MPNILPPKNITKWYTPGGTATIVPIGTCFLVDQSGNFLIDQSRNFLTTTSNTVQGKNVTLWTPSG